MLLNLDPDTRRYMIEEIQQDVANQTLYISSRLSDIGRHDYATLLLEAAQTHDEEWLAGKLRQNGRMNQQEQ